MKLINHLTTSLALAI